LEANQRWSKDFVTDILENGSYFRILTVVDQYTRECLALYTGHSLRGLDVARCLSRVVDELGAPCSITVDNGSEFYSREMDHWAYRNAVELDLFSQGNRLIITISRASMSGCEMSAGTRSYSLI
jgi:putative transposase